MKTGLIGLILLAVCLILPGASNAQTSQSVSANYQGSGIYISVSSVVYPSGSTWTLAQGANTGASSSITVESNYGWPLFYSLTASALATADTGHMKSGSSFLTEPLYINGHALSGSVTLDNNWLWYPWIRSRGYTFPLTQQVDSGDAYGNYELTIIYTVTY